MIISRRVKMLPEAPNEDSDLVDSSGIRCHWCAIIKPWYRRFNSYCRDCPSEKYQLYSRFYMTWKQR